MTDAQKASAQQQSTLILKKIQRFHDMQRILMPGLHLDEKLDFHSPSSPIFLPSSITERRTEICLDGVIDAEDRLREARLSESLINLRRQLRIRVFARKYKDENASSQGSFTRMRALHNQIQEKIRTAADQYIASRAALYQLRGSGSWESVYQILEPGDIRSLNEQTIKDTEESAREWAHRTAHRGDPPFTTSTLSLQVGEGHRTISWIWRSVTSGEADADADQSLNDGIRLEWLKARARAERWREEICLVEEEMRRVLEYGRWKARWWDTQKERRKTSCATLNEGVVAYAKEQAEVERRRVADWE
ncbi:hypothetical protein H0H92_013535, partial [Tricholoma furcatifolium]